MAIQVAWAYKSRNVSGKGRALWRVFFVTSVAISTVVASFDIYVITSSIVRNWMLQKKAETWRVEEAISCERGSGVACVKAAALWMWGTGGPIDVKKALSFYENGCLRGNEYACTVVNEIATDGGPERYFYRRRLRWPPND